MPFLDNHGHGPEGGGRAENGAHVSRVGGAIQNHGQCPLPSLRLSNKVLDGHEFQWFHQDGDPLVPGVGADQGVQFPPVLEFRFRSSPTGFAAGFLHQALQIAVPALDNRVRDDAFGIRKRRQGRVTPMNPERLQAGA